MKKLPKFLLVTISLLLAATFLTGCAGTALPQNEPYTPPAESVNGSQPFSFSLACFNLFGSGMTPAKAEQIRTHFDAAGFDLAGLQEVDNGAARTGGHDFLALLAEGTLSHRFFAPSYVLGDTYGLGILAKNELRNTHAYILPYPYKKMKGNIEPRILTRAVTEINGVPVVIYNTHLSYESVKMDGVQTRTKQLAFIADIIAADPNPYIVLTGDFNIQTANELDVLEEVGLTRVFTDAMNGGRTLIDNIFHSANLTAKNPSILERTDTDGSPLSDHAMLSVLLERNAA